MVKIFSNTGGKFRGFSLQHMPDDMVKNHKFLKFKVISSNTKFYHLYCIFLFSMQPTLTAIDCIGT